MNKPLSLLTLREELFSADEFICTLTQALLTSAKEEHKLVNFQLTYTHPNREIDKLNHYQADKLRNLGYLVEYCKYMKIYSVSGWV